MKNYLTIAKNIKPGAIDKSIDVFKKDNLKLSSSDTREYLSELNMFLYTYFLIEYNRNLESTYIDIRNSIRRCKNENLIESGMEFIKKYYNIINSKASNSDNELISKALKIINRDFNKKITLKDVSEELHISKNYLCHLFKYKTGYKFCEYVNIQRINRAKDLIEDGKKNLEFISYECGFSSQSHFSTTFKKYSGTTPLEYKRQLKNRLI